MDDAQFEQLINEGVEKIPKEFLDKIDNVAIVVGDEPTFFQRQKLNLRHGMSLFGLYEGVSQARRGGNYSGALPDKITIFKNPMLRYARSLDDLREIVKHTVWHEIAHHFGMNEQEVRHAESERRNRNDVEKIDKE